jgi:general nucleoside transport system permease protein
LTTQAGIDPVTHTNTPGPTAIGARIAPTLRAVARVLVPILLALGVSGLVLLALGKNPLVYYGDVLTRGLFTWGGLQATITRMAPLLLIAAGLIVSFQAGIWNL